MSEQQPKHDSTAVKKRGRGRPRRQPLVDVTNVRVTIEGKEAALLNTRDDLKRTDVLFSLSIPNRLLVEWWKHVESPRDFIPLLNASIDDQVVAVRSDCETVAIALARRASTLSSKITAASGRARESLLAKHCCIPVCTGNTVAPQPLLDELTEAHIELASVLAEMSEREEEVAALKASMKQLLLSKADMVNKGKMIDEVSSRQRKRKLSSFRNVAEAALWFAESFGLVINTLLMHTANSNEEVVLNLHEGDENSQSQSQAASTSSQPDSSEADHFTAMQILYLLDRFGVSDDFYHELTQVCSTLPRSHKVKAVRTHLNEEVDVVTIPDGAYRPLKPALCVVLQHEMLKYPEKFCDDQAVCVKLSGDGARFSSSSSFLLLSFSLPDIASNVLSGSGDSHQPAALTCTGNHTLAAVRGGESYKLLSSLGPVLEELNDLVEDPKLRIAGRDISLDIVLGGDFKFLLLIMGLNEAHSTYACIWCTVAAVDRWDMSVDEDVYCRLKARTLSSLKELSKYNKRPCSKHLGSIHPPLVNIEPSHIVLDELHLLLRIGDILIRNLIFVASSMDHKESERQRSVASPSHVVQVEQAIRSCGVSFQIWLKKDCNGKPISGSYDWTALNGKHKLQVLQLLPQKMPSFLPEDISLKVGSLWNDFCGLYNVISSWNPTPADIDAFHERAKRWVNSYVALCDKLEGHQKRRVTPYMHSMVYHVPQMLRTYGNIKKFSGQGVEKNNDDSKRHYYSSNKHDAPVELICSEVRLEVLARGDEEYPTCLRSKRPYRKLNDQYWHGGGIQEDRQNKRQRRE